MDNESLEKRFEIHALTRGMKTFFVRSCQWNYGTFNEMEKFGFEHSLKIDYPKEESQIILARVGHVAYVAFKCSKYFQDSMTDLDHMMIPYGEVDYGVRVHGIFLNTYLAMKNNIFGYLRAGGIHSVYCVGHSIGGAIAEMAAVDIAVHTQLESSCITFGSPMVGDRQFSFRFLCNVVHWDRYVLRGDPVRLIPKEHDYVHPCRSTMIGNLTDEWGLGVNRFCNWLSSFFGGRKESFNSADIEERHGIRSYLEAIKQVRHLN